MRCPRCQKDNAVGSDFCIWCGTPLLSTDQARGAPPPGADDLLEIKRQMNDMAVRLSRVEGRVTLMSRRMGLESVESRPPQAVAPERPSPVAGQAAPEHLVIAAARPAEPAMVAVGQQRAETPLVSAPPPQKPPQPAQSGRGMKDWEQSLPGNWLSRIGMLALFIGLGFLTQWAIATDKLVRLPLLLVGLACGGALLLAGHHWRKNYGAWAQALTGGGIGVLYLSFFASYALYDDPVMPFLATFALMFLVTILAVGIAMRRDSMAIAIIGIVGAFLVPIILSASDMHRPGDGGTNTNPGLMIGYILVLDAGIMWLSSFRKWRWFTLLGLGGSLAVYGLWYAKSGHEGTVSAAEWSLTGIFLCFFVATALFHVIRRRTPELTDLALMTVNAAVYFSASQRLMWEDYRGWLGLFSLGLAALYAITGCLAWLRSRENIRLSLFAYAIAIVFLTVAIPVQLHRSHAAWITAAWAAEGAMLIGIAVHQKMPRWQFWGLGAFALALVGLLAFNGAIDEKRFQPFINDTFWAFTISIVALYAAAFFLSRDKSAQKVFSFPAVMLTASFLTVWLFSAEIISYAGSAIIDARADRATPLELHDIENSRSLGLVGLWAAYSLCMLVAGVRKSWGWLRIGGYVLIAITCGATATLLNHSHAMVRSDSSDPVINYSFGGMLVCVCAIYIAAFLIGSQGSKLLDSEKGVFYGLIGVANALSIYALSSEVLTYVAKDSGKSMGLTMLWAGYGVALVVVGILGKWRWVRLGGLGLVCVAVLKLFILDTFHLQSGYRVAAYISLGVLLLAGGFVYHRYADVIKGFIMDRPDKGAESPQK